MEGDAVRHVTIDDLGERRMAVVRCEVEAKGLDTRSVHCVPLHVVSLQLGVGSRLGLLGDIADR